MSLVIGCMCSLRSLLGYKEITFHEDYDALRLKTIGANEQTILSDQTTASYENKNLDSLTIAIVIAIIVFCLFLGFIVWVLVCAPMNGRNNITNNLCIRA